MQGLVGGNLAGQRNAQLGTIDGPRQPAGELIVDSLRNLIEKTSVVEARLRTLNERVFGSVPSNPTPNEGIRGSDGLVSTVTIQLQELHDKMERILGTIYELERLA